MPEVSKAPLNLNLGAAEFIPPWLKKSSSKPVTAPKPSNKQSFTTTIATPFVPTSHSMMSRDAAPFIPHANGANIFSSVNTITNRRMGPGVSPYAGPVNRQVTTDGNYSPGISPMASVGTKPTAVPSRKANSGSNISGVVSPTSKPYPDPLPKTPLVAAAVINGKTKEELRNISLKSGLKVTAASFVPSQRRMKDATALTPMSLTPVVDDPDMLLADTWCLYFLPTPAKNENLFEPVLVFRIDSVASFWKAFNNLPPADEMPARSSMYLFRDDIMPKWEDHKNSSGGLYTVSVKKSVADDVWIRTAAKTIGESWKRSFRNNINGVVFKPRDKAMKLEVWVSKEAEGFEVDWFSSFEDVVESTGIDYCTHAEKQELIKNAPAPKKSKNRRQ
eukprot:Tbor_TRINITY_DN4567_c0_g1::TRINITY_DN4567_c0_g1_i1::g.15820::m.15820/K03259/EIF4E; translation initiation factor 4E